MQPVSKICQKFPNTSKLGNYYGCFLIPRDFIHNQNMTTTIQQYDLSCEILETFREQGTLNWEHLTGKKKKMYLIE